MAHPGIILLASSPEPQEAQLPAGHCPAVAKSVSHSVPHWRPADDYNGSLHLTAAPGSPAPCRSLLAVAKSVSHSVPHWRPADDYNGSLHLTAVPTGPAMILRPPAPALLSSQLCAFGSPYNLRLALLPSPLPRLLRPPASALPMSPTCAFNRTCAILHVISDRESLCFNQQY
jgi:hypothetical protein